ncbi:MAG TPA: MFS transporter [Chitinophagaceae bacterium]|nr:MFS transporter [Chitinophagaceae bacterium]
MSTKFPYRFRVLVFLFFLLLITYLDRNCIGLLGTRIKNEFHLNNEQFGWVMAAFALAYAVFEIPSGILSDRIGQRAVFIRIVSWWSVFTVLTGFTTGFTSLIIVRFLFGMGEAGVFPTCSGTFSRWFPVSETARSINITTFAQSVSLAIAPLIIIPLAAHYGWRTTFYINGLIGFVWVAVCYAWFKNQPSEMKGMSKKERTYIEENRRFKTGNHHISLKSLLKSRSLIAISAIHFCASWGFYFFIGWLPTYLTEGRNFLEQDSKMLIALMFGTGILIVPLGGIFSDWLTRKKGLLFSRRSLGMTILGGTAVALLVVGLTSSNIVVAISLVIAYIFFPLNNTNNYSVCIDLGGNNAGAVAGVMNFTAQMGAFIMLILFGKLVNLTHSYNIPVIVIASILLVGFLLWFLVDPRKQITA